ncbi:DUF2249 domain-containing protein [Motiliproteus sp.]|uniref:DUF2249 domain-containing protein n=1 Tax=Motiliproteus sp. TaxID=1898955 RepID=UPI003BAB2241
MLDPDRLAPIELDVSELEPPEPLLEVFKALCQLPAGHRLQVIHRRTPYPLFEMLALSGYHHRCQQQLQQVLIQIWPGENADPEALARLVSAAGPCE